MSCTKSMAIDMQCSLISHNLIALEEILNEIDFNLGD